MHLNPKAGDGLGLQLGAVCVPEMCRTLGSISSTEKTNKLVILKVYKFRNFTFIMLCAQKKKNLI